MKYITEADFLKITGQKDLKATRDNVTFKSIKEIGTDNILSRDYKPTDNFISKGELLKYAERKGLSIMNVIRKLPGQKDIEIR